MHSLNRIPTLTRARSTSNSVLPAAAIAVVSEVNPDKLGAFLFFWLVSFILLIGLTSQSHALPAFQTRTAMNNASYQNSTIEVTPMLFHHIELGMSYKAVLSMVGKTPLYCDSGFSHCTAQDSMLSERCIEDEFIKPNRHWLCHWDGSRSTSRRPGNLQVWFNGNHVSHVSATVPNGTTYRRDPSNNVHLEKAPS